MPAQKASKIPAKEGQKTEDHHFLGEPNDHGRGDCRAFGWDDIYGMLRRRSSRLLGS